ncbi:cold shock domain-containing protein [Sphingopyxis indica]|nr:cold shock domain-containing protein [Sphingopyxis indica]WOF41878.1 cold shock domain-containing protein [Sphingopyxis indica]
MKLESNVTLFIDGIDIRPADISFDQYIQCIQGLANAAWQVNTEFFANIKDSKGRMKVCLLMRPDILDQMGFQNLNGKVRDNGVVLNWQTTYDEFRTSPIFKMISGIIARQQPIKIEPQECWKHYFPYSLQNQRISEKQDDPFIGLLRYSFYRPRDIVQYLILMQNYVQQNQNEKNHFTEKSFHKCEREFSDYLLGEVKDYLSFYYNSFDFDQIVGFFSTLRGRNNFSWEHFSNSFNEYKSKLSDELTGVDELRGTPQKFLQFLYSLNFIGYIEQDEFGGNFVHWCFRDRTPVKLRPQVKYDRTYTVHPGLARSLLVGRAGVSARPPRITHRTSKRKHHAPPSGLRIGRIISGKMQKGFTFLKPNDGGEDVFVSLDLIRKEGIGKIRKGDELIFEAAIGSTGRLRAISLKRP